MTMIAAERRGAAPEPGARELVTMTVAGQEVAIPVATVQDVLGPQPLTPVPLADPEIAGLLNLRGRIVTAIDLRRRLGIADGAGTGRAMNVVIDHQEELYSLLVDSVGDVLEIARDGLTCDPTLLTPCWRRMAADIHALENRLLVVLDIGRVLDLHAPCRGFSDRS
jgi:purine-binding chemotaxis protein CheW